MDIVRELRRGLEHGSGDDELQQLFERAEFPDDLEEMARLVERSVENNSAYIMLIFIDAIEFKGEHIRAFYDGMRDRFEEAYSTSFDRRRREGRLGDPDTAGPVRAGLDHTGVQGIDK